MQTLQQDYATTTGCRAVGKVTLQFEVDIPMAKYVIALVSVVLREEVARFCDNSANDDLPAALDYLLDVLRDQTPEDIEEMDWTKDEVKFINKLIGEKKYRVSR